MQDHAAGVCDGIYEGCDLREGVRERKERLNL